ncbi:hypothetical protein SAMN05443247_04552 [Bradyrhizobium erythrophlei]|nr:hypothetical protein SAMN05443247_04552 [Bradyrhizobium erythrophlei]
MVPDKPKQAWALAAHKTRQEISALQRGNRELGLKDLADKSGLNPQTLRRRVSALDFLERFEQETKIKSAVLETFPVAAIEFLSRWYSHDPIAAKKAAIKLIDGNITVEKLRLEEKQSRTTSAFARTGKSLELDYKHEIAGAISSWFQGPLIKVEKRIRFDPTSLVDFRSDDTYRRRKTGFLIVGPYRDPALYKRRAFDWIAKAYTLLPVFQAMCLVLPDNAKVDDFLDWWRPLNISPHHLALLKFPRGQRGQLWPPNSEIGRY